MADIETSGDVVFVFSNGLTDPRLPGSEILFSNLEFPRRVIEATLESFIRPLFNNWYYTGAMAFGLPE